MEISILLSEKDLYKCGRRKTVPRLGEKNSVSTSLHSLLVVQMSENRGAS